MPDDLEPWFLVRDRRLCCFNSVGQRHETVLIDQHQEFVRIALEWLVKVEVDFLLGLRQNLHALQLVLSSDAFWPPWWPFGFLF